MILDVHSLAKAGLGEAEIRKLLCCETEEEQIRILRKYRFCLLDEIHDRQQSLDEIDYMICCIRKHSKENGGGLEEYGKLR